MMVSSIFQSKHTKIIKAEQTSLEMEMLQLPPEVIAETLNN